MAVVFERKTRVWVGNSSSKHYIERNFKYVPGSPDC